MTNFRAMAVAAAIAIASSGIPAQTVLWQHAPATPNSDYNYGAVLAVLKDVDFDGVNDIVVGSSGASNGSIPAAGYVGVLSGATGVPVWEYYGTSAFMTLKFEDVAGDVNGDGADDFWASYIPSPGAGLLTVVLSGANGSWIPNPPLNSYPPFIPAGDLNGDAVGDYAVTSTMLTAYAGPSVTTTLWSVPHNVPGTGAAFKSVVPIGDINGDGFGDLLAGATGSCSMFTTPGPGRAYVVSGANGAFLQQWNGTANCDSFGVRVTSPGDLDGDGKADAVVGSPGATTVYVFSSGTGASLGTLPGVAGSDMGLCSLGDVDGDGFGDFAHQFTSFAPYFIGVNVISGNTLTPLHTFNVLPYTYLGATCAAPGDLNGDGFPDLVVGHTASSGNGSVIAVSLAPVGVTPAGSGCPLASGVVPRIGATGSLTPGQLFTVNLSNVTPGRPAYLVLGGSNTVWNGTPLPLDLASSGLAGCQLYVSIDLLIPLVTMQVSPGAGAASVAGITPPLSGATFYAQWGVENPPGSPQIGAVSGAIAIAIQ